MRAKISYSLKILTVISALLGMILNSVYARYDGYSHWSKRLMYFTTQSNLWVLVIFAVLLILPFTKYGAECLVRKSLYTVKFIFTVSITITCIVFCVFLGPFAGDSYHAWSFYSLLLHVITPALAVADFFVDDVRYRLGTRQIFESTIPAFLYFALASVLCAFGVDYGRGEPYPYFFMNFNSPAGIFGFSFAPPNYIGSFYWIVLFWFIMLGMAALYVKLNSKTIKKDNK